MWGLGREIERQRPRQRRRGERRGKGTGEKRKEGVGEESKERRRKGERKDSGRPGSESLQQWLYPRMNVDFLCPLTSSVNMLFVCLFVFSCLSPSSKHSQRSWAQHARAHQGGSASYVWAPVPCFPVPLSSRDLYQLGRASPLRLSPNRARLQGFDQSSFWVLVSGCRLFDHLVNRALGTGKVCFLLWCGIALTYPFKPKSFL